MHSSPRRTPVIATSHRYRPVPGAPYGLRDRFGNVLRRGGGQRPVRDSRWLSGLSRVPGDPLPALGRREGAGQDAVDVPDRLRRHRPAYVRFASRAPAVMIPVAWSAAWAPVRPGIAGHHRSTTLADVQQPLVGEYRQGMLQRRHRDALQSAHLPDRAKPLTRREHPGADRISDRVRHLLPGRLIGRSGCGSGLKPRHPLERSQRGCAPLP
jgi:hypothetical protein